MGVPRRQTRAERDLRACLIRELREELGIEVDVGELVESLTHAYPEKTVHLQVLPLPLEAARAAAAGLPGLPVGDGR